MARELSLAVESAVCTKAAVERVPACGGGDGTDSGSNGSTLDLGGVVQVDEEEDGEDATTGVTGGTVADGTSAGLPGAAPTAVVDTVARYCMMILVVSVLPAPDSPLTRIDWLWKEDDFAAPPGGCAMAL